MPSHPKKRTLEPPRETPKESLNFYLHHLEQVDKLLNIIELLKKENKQLRNMLKINSEQANNTQESPTSYSKPKITCWTFKEED